MDACTLLPGGGTFRTLDERHGLWVIEQRRNDGTIYRWMCSIQREVGGLLAETVVRCSTGRNITRSGGVTRFDRDLLMPQYHAAMVAGLELHLGSLRRILLLGVGGGALAMFLQHTYGPGLSLTCVESNRAAIDLGRAYFGLASSRSLRLVVGSAESFLQSCTDVFDAILVDTTEQERNLRCSLSAPHHAICQRRAMRKLFGRLAARGVLVINALGDDRSLRRLQQTLVSSCNKRSGVHRIFTDEGNVVFAASVGVGRHTHAHSLPAGWQDACARIGLNARHASEAWPHDACDKG